MTDPRLTVDPILGAFIDGEVLPAVGISPSTFWSGLCVSLVKRGPRNASLLALRDVLQRHIDDWHTSPANVGATVASYRDFLRGIGYLSPAVEPFEITASDVDLEISCLHGPQLVVPVTNPRYALNAANARWGSLYDALYGTDALGDAAPAGPYDVVRGAQVVAWGRRFLDEVLPLRDGSHADVAAYFVESGVLVVTLTDGGRAALVDPSAFAGHRGDAGAPTSVMFGHHGLGIELLFDRNHPVGAADPAGICDVVIESALTTIVDFEDSVACVDAEDKVAAYRNWLGLIQGSLRATVAKDGSTFERSLAGDREIIAPDGTTVAVRGRSLLLARVVGHLMTTDAVLLDGRAVPEGILDTFVISAISLHDQNRPEALRNSRHGSVYIVKPKMHGPEEVAFACEVIGDVERTLAMKHGTIKLGIMDEERRTTVNLEACIRAAADRVVFINTGFLDRTGDEIHTSMYAGPMVRKNDMRATTWIQAYEDWNMDVGLRCGFRGRAQIGKGMWAAPDRMADMLAQKIAHPEAGASCAWVPSPTAATLHATHYHRVDVDARQAELTGAQRAHLDDLLSIPTSNPDAWSTDEIHAELDNNLQGILGYVVRWVDQGVGCSKVPDIGDVGLMEDRATCRVSSQHVANWLTHGIVTVDDVEAALHRMAAVVDRQNTGDDAYKPMAPTFDGPAFLAAKTLVLEGAAAPSGYTEPVLQAWRRVVKTSSIADANREHHAQEPDQEITPR